MHCWMQADACVCDTDNKDGAAAAAAAADIDGRLWWLHCSRSCLAADQRRSCSACGHTCLCTYRNPPTRTIPKHQVCPSAVFFKVLKITLQFNKLENSQGESFLFFCFFIVHKEAFSALTPLVGCQEEHLACKHWLMRCWCGYLSGVKCILFAYGPADAVISCLI